MKIKLSLLVVSFLFVMANLAIAQSVTPQQLEMFKQLSPEQQQALIGKIGAGTNKVTMAVPETPELFQQQDITTGPATLSKNDIIVLEVNKTNDSVTGFQENLIGKNTFTLNQYGELELTPYIRVKLNGLTMELAALKLMTTPELKGLVVTVSKLGSKDYSSDKLKPFGYEFFSDVPTSFAPATDIPVPVNYVIGPGDVVQITLFGNKNQEYHLAVSREGVLNFPEIGPIVVIGLKFEKLKNMLLERIQSQMIGVNASITMGPLRSIRVFVLGDVNRPGSYTVSSLTTITNALFLSGGIKEIGSLRNIQLKRNGRIVGKFDLYDLLLHGDSRGDKRLLPGDVIFIPPVEKTIAVAGEVVRPAIYEAKSKTTLEDIIKIAGGFTAGAYPNLSRLERVNKQRAKTVVNIDLTKKSESKIKVRNGDYLRILSVLKNKKGVVVLNGYAERKGVYQWYKGMRLSKLIPSLDELLPKTDFGYVLIKRESLPERKHSFLSLDLIKAITNLDDDKLNPELNERDTVYLFSTEENRISILDPIIEELKNQANHKELVKIVSVGGKVRFPGRYPLENNMRISDLIRAGGNLHEAAYSHEALITHYTVINGQYRTTEHSTINLGAILDGDDSQDILLKPYDHIVIKEIPLWKEQEKVTIMGEIKFPGEYTIKRGETLKQLLDRVGGLTDMAFPDGSVFMRKDLQVREQQQLDALATRLESDLSAMALESSQQTVQSAAENIQSQQMAKSLVSRLRATKAAGRMVIDLDRVIQYADDGDEYDIVLKDGDNLIVPKETQEVTIIGEVQYATSHLYNIDLNRDDYINRSGGLTYKADDDRIYIVRANGEVVSSEQSSEWFSETHMAVKPGDTIVVPLDAERMRPLSLWTNITQIIYQLGVAAAAWHTVGVF